MVRHGKNHGDGGYVLEAPKDSITIDIYRSMMKFITRLVWPKSENPHVYSEAYYYYAAVGRRLDDRTGSHGIVGY